MKGIFSVLVMIALVSCEQQVPNKAESAKTASESYFNKKVECQKQEDRVKKDLLQTSYALQTLEELFYSPSLDTCVAVTYSVYPKTKLTADITDILTDKQLWYAEYPMSKSYEDVMSDVNKHIESMGLEKVR